jgi:hypothetical protein
METAFQRNAFQHNAFQIVDMTSTSNMQKPINCIMANQQMYKSSGRTFEGGAARLKVTPRMTPGSLFNKLSD